MKKYLLFFVLILSLCSFSATKKTTKTKSKTTKKTKTARSTKKSTSSKKEIMNRMSFEDITIKDGRKPPKDYEKVREILLKKK